jgi:hypothetical protein
LKENDGGLFCCILVASSSLALYDISIFVVSDCAAVDLQGKYAELSPTVVFVAG